MTRWTLLLGLLTACGDKNDTGSEADLGCTEEVEPLSMEEDSPLGFGGRALTTLAGGEHSAPFTYQDGTETTMTVSVSYTGGQIRYVDREVEEGGDGMEPAIEEAAALCPDTVEVDVALEIETADGAFNEEWESYVYATSADLASFYQEFDPTDLVGTYEIAAALTAAEVTDYDELRAWASGTIDLSGTNGALEAQASGTEDCPDEDECAAWAASVPIGSWVADSS